MKQHFGDVSKKYFSDLKGKYPKPSFRIVSNLQHAGAYIPDKNEFVINADFANDEWTLKSVMYHESIHYYQIQQFGFNRILFKLHGYHDDYFFDMAKKINTGENDPKLVTKTGEYKSIKSKSAKKFWVYIMLKDDKIYAYWSAKHDDRLIDRMLKFDTYLDYDDAFATPGDKIYDDVKSAVNKSKKTML